MYDLWMAASSAATRLRELQRSDGSGLSYDYRQDLAEKVGHIGQELETVAQEMFDALDKLEEEREKQEIDGPLG